MLDSPIEILVELVIETSNLLLSSHEHSKPITRRQILDSSKLKKIADDNFKFDENGRKLSKGVENTVGKGEIACYGQFLLFPHCFQNACFPWASKGVLVWEWVNSLPNDKILDVTKFKAEYNTLGKGENAGYQHFLLFQQCFPKPFLKGR